MWSDFVLLAAPKVLEFPSRSQFITLIEALRKKSFRLSPDSHADGLIRALWSELGGQLAGRIREGRTPPGAQLLVRHESPPLADIIRDINKFSNNVMARQVFQSLSSETPASTESARRRIAGWLDSRGLRFGELVMDNGSGLSRIERISTGSLNLLADLRQRDERDSQRSVARGGAPRVRHGGTPALHSPWRAADDQR